MHILLIPLKAQQAVLPVETAVKKSQRKKIGLVLSGGGARGFAHIGVLKVLEENRIPVDYVGGASMGGLIGALYAMGKTPAEIEILIESLDWEQLLRGRTYFEDLSLRRKEDRRNIPAPIILRGKINKLNVPNALNSGHQIGLLFDRETLPYVSTADFRELPIPFQTVATDIVRGESVTLNQGSLSAALRATMSIPGVFAPVQFEGRQLVDGGLLNNIPTDIVKEMGADILLVVNIETPLGDENTLNSIFGVLGQTINVATVGNSRRSLRQADIIIAPALGEFSSTSFQSSKKIIELGYAGAKDKETILQGLSLNEADWQEHLATRRARIKTEPNPTVADTEIVGTNNERAAERVAQKIGDQFDGATLDDLTQKRLAQDLTELTGTGRFDTLGYGLRKRNGENILQIRIQDSERRVTSPTTLEVGFDVNSIDTENVSFGVRGRLTFFDIGRYGTEWRNDVVLGTNTLFASEYFRPLAESKYFIAPHARYERQILNFFDRGNQTATYVQSTTQAGVDFGYLFNERAQLRVGLNTGFLRGERRVGNPDSPNLKGAFTNVAARFTYDGLNRSQVPTKGFLTNITLAQYFRAPLATRDFTQLDGRIIGFRPLTSRNNLIYFGSGGTNFGKDAPLFQQFSLGGALRLGGYGRGEFRGSNYAQAGFGVLHSPATLPVLFGGKLYVGGWVEGGTIYNRLNDAPFLPSATGGILVETRLGPVFFGGSLGEGGRQRIYFSFGRFF